MQAAAEAPRTLHWVVPPGEEPTLSTKHLTDILPVAGPEQTPYPERWSFQPFTFAVDPSPTIENLKKDEVRPRDPIVDIALSKFVNRLQEHDIGNRQVPLAIDFNERNAFAEKTTELANKRLLRRFAKNIVESQVVQTVARTMRMKKWGISDKDIPHVVIRPGTGELDLLLHPADYGFLPEPKPFFFYVSAVAEFPKEYISTFTGTDGEPHSAEEHDFSRQQITRAATHNGVIFRVNKETGKITGYWWMSTQGNHILREAPEEQALEEVAIRFSVHNGDIFVTDRFDYHLKDGEKPFVNWDEWKALPVHRQLHEMAQRFKAMGLLDDKVDVTLFTPDAPYHGEFISDAINRSDLGEGMYSMYITGIGLVVVSPSGGGKTEWSELAEKHHLTPVSHIGFTGGYVYKPEGAPADVDYAKGSVELRENADGYILRQKIADGSILPDSFRGARPDRDLTYQEKMEMLAKYEAWQQKELSEHAMIPVHQAGAPQEGFCMVHLHGHPDEELVKQFGDNVEIVEPDYTLYPMVDMPCGSMGGNGSLRSALIKSKFFTAAHKEGEHFLRNKLILVKLRGHGIVAISENPEVAVELVGKYTGLSRPPKDTV